MTLIINTLIDNGPIIFLRLAEGSVGEIDAVIESSYNTETELIKYVNLTQINSLYADKYGLSPRKLQEDVQYTESSSSYTLGSNGLPEYSSSLFNSLSFSSTRTQNLRHIDSNQEEKIN